MQSGVSQRSDENEILLIRYRTRDSSVGIATRYELNGPGIESQWARGTRPDRPWGNPASNAMGIGSFPGVRRPGRGVDHSPHLAPRLKTEYSYTSIPPLGLRGLFWGELYLLTYYHYVHGDPRTDKIM
jgi:hypothetical protein